MRLTLLAPYFTGSHKAWGKSLRDRSLHEVNVLSLPGRFWKWRMHGGAVTLARRFSEQRPKPDLIIATDMLDLTTFQALTRRQTADTPFAVYFHENQLTYPPRTGQKRDLHYGFINYATMLAADAVLFNSQYHLDAILDELPRLLKHFPDYNELHTIEQIASKSHILPLGVDLTRFDAYHPEKQPDGPLRILWNHRWEYDKQPSVFFEALYALQSDGVPFQVVILGESFRQRPEEFLEAQRRLADHILHVGYADFPKYARLMWEADVQVSCAIQDFFGASTCEAIYCNSLPLLPDRLNYPAFIPEEHRDLCLYDNLAGLIERLHWAAAHVEQVRRISLADHVRQYNWEQIIGTYDALFETIAANHGSGA